MTNRQLIFSRKTTPSVKHLFLRSFIIYLLSFYGGQALAQPTLTTTNITVCPGAQVNLNSLITTNSDIVTWSEKPQATAIAAGAFHSVAILSDGKVIAWGRNQYGQATVPNTVTGAKAIAAGSFHNLALMPNGTVIGWGDNSDGRINIPNTVTGAVGVTAGFPHSVALLSNGSVVAWGNNFEGALNVPNTVVGATAISGTANHTLALLSNGSVVGWGRSSEGQLNVPNTVVNAKAVATGYSHSLALLNNGSVIAWGDNSSGQTAVPNTVVNAKAIAAGYYHNLALMSNGTVIGWGVNPFGQLNIPNNIIATAIAANLSHSLVLTINGAVLGYGDNGYGQAAGYDPVPINVTLVTANATKTYYVVAHDANGNKKVDSVVVTVTNMTVGATTVNSPSSVNGTDGSVTLTATGGTLPYTYKRSGSNTTNQTGIFTGLSAGSYSFTATDNNGCTASATAQVFDPLFLTTNNTTICPGNSVNLSSLISTNGSLVSWSEKPQAIKIAANESSSLILLSNGSVVGMGSNFQQQISVPNTVVSAKAIETGGNHSLAILSNGSVIGWGNNSLGQSTIPNTVVNAKAVAGGYSHSLALLNNGTVVGWGSNTSGQTTVPNTVVGATAIAAGDNHSLALLSDGMVASWGNNSAGQTTVPNTVVGATTIAAGDYHSLAILSNGNVVGWGRNTSGQTTVPNTVVGAKAIAGGGFHSLAVLSDGTVIGWGSNTSGQTTVPNTVVGATMVAAGYIYSLALLSDGRVIGWGDNSSGQAAGYDPTPLSNTTVSPTTTKTYYVVVRNANGAIDSGTVTVNVAVPTFGTPIITNLQCFGDSNGEFIVSATGGTGDMTYSISPNVGVQVLAGVFTSLTAQTYTITATSANGCSNTITREVTQPSKITFSTPSVTPIKCNGNIDGQVTLSATGGTGNIIYNISPNTGTQNPAGTFTGLTAQTYTFTASDANGCSNTTTIPITQPAILNFNTPSVNSPSTVGGTDGSVLVTVRGGTAPFTYKISGSNTTNQTGQFTGLSTGTYSFTATDNNGCPAVTTTAQITDPVTLTTSNTSIACNSSIDLNSLISTNASSISWSEKPQATAIAAGSAFSLALLSDGSVIGWGNNTNGQITIPNTVVGAKGISAGSSHGLALLSNGSVVGWGSNTNGQITIPNTVVGAKSIASGSLHNLALLGDGSVVGWGLNANGQTTVPNTVVNAKAIGTGLNHSLAILNNGTAIGWGTNGNGQSTVPNTVVDPKALVGGLTHSLALLQNGSVISWGTAATVPNTVVNAKSIAANSSFSLALLGDGSVVGWGSNSQGQLNIPNTVVGATAIAAGSAHSLALLGNGSVIGWGNNDYGQSAGYDATPLSNTTVSPSTTKTYYVVVKDVHGNKTTGSVTVTVGNPAFPTTTTNNALNFDGSNDYVEILNCANTPLSISEALTIEYWFKGTSLQSAVRMQPSGGNSYIVAGWNGKHIISSDGGITDGISVGAAATNGNWHHVAMTWQRGATNGFKSYLDGDLVEQRNAGNVTLPIFSSGFYIGSFLGTSEYMSGSIDEVRVWNVARTQSELQNNRLGCDNLAGTPGLLMYYQFNHGTANGNNNSVSTLSNSANSNTFPAILRNFTRTGSTSNWVASPLCTGTLPVELLQFGGKNTEGGNVLTWQTGEETNALSFDIERSRDGQFFTPIGTVKAKGSNATYDFIDAQYPRGVNYYRLKMTDLDVKTDYSKTISIQSNGKSTVKIYPSVTTGHLTIENAKSFQIINTVGQVVEVQKQGLGNFQSFLNLSLSHLPNGIYIMKGVDTEGGIFSEKVVKQ